MLRFFDAAEGFRPIKNYLKIYILLDWNIFLKFLGPILKKKRQEQLYLNKTMDRSHQDITLGLYRSHPLGLTP